MIKFTFCYETITPESAEDGDFSDNGFILPGHWTYSINEEETKKDILSNPDDYSIFWPDYRLDQIIEFARDLGICCNNGSWLESVDPDIDYQTGESTFYSFHMDDVSPSTYKRICHLLGVK